MGNFLFLCLGDLGIRFSLKESTSPTDVPRLTSVIMLVEVRELYNSNGSKDLEVDTQANRGDGTKGVGVLVCFSWKMNVFLSNEPDNSKHGNTPVLEFSPTSICEILLNLGKSHRIETNISGHGSIKLLWTRKEWEGLRHLSIES
jgi:hypothetical protein